MKQLTMSTRLHRPTCGKHKPGDGPPSGSTLCSRTLQGVYGMRRSSCISVQESQGYLCTSDISALPVRRFRSRRRPDRKVLPLRDHPGTSPSVPRVRARWSCSSSALAGYRLEVVCLLEGILPQFAVPGMKVENCGLRDTSRRAFHYSKATTDSSSLFPFGGRAVGHLAVRTDFDLTLHQRPRAFPWNIRSGSKREVHPVRY